MTEMAFVENVNNASAILEFFTRYRIYL